MDRRYAIALLLAITCLSACKSKPLANVAAMDPGQQDLPFSQKPPEQKSTPELSSSFKLPAGTPISIRLQQPLSSDSAKAGQKFTAVLDESLALNGVTVLQRGTPVSGRVLAVRSGGMSHSKSVLQIALESLDSSQGPIVVSTSSVIASSPALNPMPNSDAVETTAYTRGSRVHVGAERRLTFRLRAPATLPALIEPASAPPRS